MDSLTQIVLGAACGEIVAGKKLGNRALLWGAVGGTIPDLDVFLSPLVTKYQELALHRGFSHSITFAILGSFLFAWMVQWIYRSKYHRSLALMGWSLFPIATIYFISRIFSGEKAGYTSITILSLLLTFMLYRLYKTYFVLPYEPPEATMKDWRRLFFWSLLTHPILDCFTTYGTQFFLPFSNYRVAFNSVAVADPAYTFPFLLCILVCAFVYRTNDLRRKLAWAGIIWGSFYLSLGLLIKTKIDSVVEKNIIALNIPSKRYMTSPTILNSVLWTTVIEIDSGYYSGQYSLFDKSETINFKFIPKDYEKLSGYLEDPVVKRISWFSKGYYSVGQSSAGILQLNDMRFGSIDSNGEAYYIFHFPVEKNVDGHLEILDLKGGPPPGRRDDMIKELWHRIKGV